MSGRISTDQLKMVADSLLLLDTKNPSDWDIDGNPSLTAISSIVGFKVDKETLEIAVASEGAAIPHNEEARKDTPPGAGGEEVESVPTPPAYLSNDDRLTSMANELKELCQKRDEVSLRLTSVSCEYKGLVDRIGRLEQEKADICSKSDTFVAENMRFLASQHRQRILEAEQQSALHAVALASGAARSKNPIDYGRPRKK